MELLELLHILLICAITDARGTDFLQLKLHKASQHVKKYEKEYDRPVLRIVVIGIGWG